MDHSDMQYWHGIVILLDADIFDAPHFIGVMFVVQIILGVVMWVHMYGC